MLDSFRHDGGIYTRATPEATAKAQDDGGHRFLACTHCGQTMWMCKGLALNSNGSYNGARNIFYIGESAECSCPLAELRHVEFSHRIAPL